MPRGIKAKINCALMISGAYFSGIKFIKICERRTDRETDGAARRQADRAQNIYAYECICMLRLSHTDTQTHTHTQPEEDGSLRLALPAQGNR